MLLREFVQLYLGKLYEATAYARHAKQDASLPPLEQNVVEQLAALAVQGSAFIHFSDLNKLGVYPGSTESTGPWGLYFYELNQNTLNQLRDNQIPYASERKYIHVFKSRNNPKMLDLQAYSQENLKQDFYKALSLVEKVKTADPQEITRFKRRAIYVLRHSGSPGATIWNLTKMLADENLDDTAKAVKGTNAKAWRSAFVRLGYDGVIDHGDGIIHPDEKAQGLFFSSQFIEQTSVFDNPKFKEIEITKQYSSGKKKVTSQAFDTYRNHKNGMLSLAMYTKPPSQTNYTMEDITGDDRDRKEGAIGALTLPAELLHSIYEEDDNYRIRRAVVAKLPEGELSRYVDDESETVRKTVAWRIPTDELYKFKDEYDSEVLQHVIKRTNDEELLHHIATNYELDHFMRLHALEKMQTTEKISEFYKDEDGDIRLHVAHIIPLIKSNEGEIESLLEDESMEVKKAMKARLRSKGFNPFRLETLPQ